MAETHAARAERRRNPLRNETPYLVGKPYHTQFEWIVAELCGSTSTAAMVRYLGGRASYWQVRDWREGRSKPRRDVMEWLEAKSLEHEARARALAQACQRVEIGLPYYPNIKAWHARRAAEGR